MMGRIFFGFDFAIEKKYAFRCGCVTKESLKIENNGETGPKSLGTYEKRKTHVKIATSTTR